MHTIEDAKPHTRWKKYDRTKALIEVIKVIDVGGVRTVEGREVGTEKIIDVPEAEFLRAWRRIDGPKEPAFRPEAPPQISKKLIDAARKDKLAIIRYGIDHTFAEGPGLGFIGGTTAMPRPAAEELWADINARAYGERTKAEEILVELLQEQRYFELVEQFAIEEDRALKIVGYIAELATKKPCSRT